MTSRTDITQRVLGQCRAMGFALAGVCDARPSEFAEQVRAWLAAGRHGEMGYLARNLELRLDPAKMVPGAQAIICVADRYANSSLASVEGPGVRLCASDDDHRAHPHPSPLPKGTGEVAGRVARYARGEDYHKVMRKRLTALCRELSREYPDETFRACVDTAPVLEREYAQRAGLGAIGKNTMLLQRGVGSWLLLGEIITTLPLAASPPAEPDPCGTCTRCIDACPTQAIAPQGWHIDATRCISYLTIEHRSAIDERYHEAMGDWLFGCDVCQEVCPHNQEKSRNREAAVHPAYVPQRESLDLLEVLGWDEEARQQALVNSAMKRAHLDMLKRNALIVAGNVLRNGGDSKVLQRWIEQLARAHDEAVMVRETARAVLDSLQHPKIAQVHRSHGELVIAVDIDTAAQET